MFKSEKRVSYGTKRIRGSKLSWAVGKKTVMCVGTTSMVFVATVENFPEATHNEAAGGYWIRGGNASNNCTVLSNLGVKVEFFGMLSNLSMYQLLVDDLTARGIIVENCPTCSQSAPFSSVILSKSPRARSIVICNSNFPHVGIEDFRKLDLSKYGWIHMRALYFENTLAMLKELAAYNASKEEKIIVSLEFDHNLEEMWPLTEYCDYAFFSKQLAQPNGWTSLEDACSQLDEKLRMRWGLNLKRPYVIVLWGDQGAGIMDLEGNFTHSKPYKPRRINSFLGAGDTFVGAVIYALYIRERSLPVAVDFGNRMASFKMTRSGFDHIANILLPPTL
ncbi:ketohexokinase-like [Drosophila ficusphila]|uniref:ketohexokinase-like n=1 Tax=Drosophila ficusphila TaxID=30025 RepID=UPI0007E5F37C|nr:ketohexokinase-like [Drosophila ficusphila]